VITTYCPNFAVWLVKKDGDRVLFARARCKRWTCEHCAEINKAVWTARMLYAVDLIGGDWSFVTLTAHEKTRSKLASWQNISKGWNRLNLRLKRHFGAFYYVRVYELTKRGSFHLHMLISLKVPTRWWKDNARKCGMGYQAKSEVLENSHHAVFYCAKYMTKQTADFPTNVRRITCSQNFPDREKDKSHEWQVVGHDILMGDLLHHTNNLRLPAIDFDTGHTITTDDYLVDNWFNLD
jgi:hypothetical protein